MHRDHDRSLKSRLLEALAVLCPVDVARVLTAWFGAAPAPIAIEARDTRRRVRRD